MVNGLTVQPIENEGALSDTLLQFEEVYVFLSADWCNGGNLTFHNTIFPHLEVLNERNIPLVVVYIGDLKRYNFRSLKTDHPFLIYHLIDSWPDMGYFDKKRLSNIIEELDEKFTFQNIVPLWIHMKNGKVVSEKNLYYLTQNDAYWQREDKSD
jgi:hypothetical protein